MDVDSALSVDDSAHFDPVENVRPLRKRRRGKVNHDPYGGDGFVWDDTDFFATTAMSELHYGEVRQPESHCAEILDRGAMEESSDPRSIAAQRVDQLQRHLSLHSHLTESMQELGLGEMMDWRQPQRAWWQESDSFGEESSYDRDDLRSLPHHNTPPAPKAPALQEEKHADKKTVVFHCPYFECHHKMEQQNLSMPVNAQKRACVHAGCGYYSSTSKQWLAHVSAAHHDLQGPPIPNDDQKQEVKAFL